MTMIDVSHVTMQFNMANDKIISLKETVVALLRGKLKYKKFTQLCRTSAVQGSNSGRCQHDEVTGKL